MFLLWIALMTRNGCGFVVIIWLLLCWAAFSDPRVRAQLPGAFHFGVDQAELMAKRISKGFTPVLAI